MPEAERLYDITRPLFTGNPVWPGDSPCQVAWTSRLAEGAIANVSELRMTSHCGTHVDAPLHAVERGRPVGDLPLEAFLGRARVVDVRGAQRLDEPLLADAMGDDPVERVLFFTGCWTDPEIFPTTFPPLTGEAAALLRQRGVVLVGTDAPSVDPFEADELVAHRVLAEAGIVIAENLLLDAVPPGDYELLMLPLRLAEADASPVRALLRPW